MRDTILSKCYKKYQPIEELGVGSVCAGAWGVGGCGLGARGGRGKPPPKSRGPSWTKCEYLLWI